MTTPHPSSWIKSFLLKHHLTPSYDQLIILSRFFLIVLNYLIIYRWRQPNFNPVLFPIFSHLFLVCYGITGWFGPILFSYRIVNLLLTILDIALISFGFYYLPENVFGGSVLIYLIGVVLNIFYGGHISSLGLSILASLGLTWATFHHPNPVNIDGYYFKILNFNITTLIICIVGYKIKNIICLVEQEKDETKKQLNRLQALSRIAREIAGELEIEKLLFLIVQKAAELTKSQAAGIILKENDQIYRIKATKGLPRTFLEKEVSPGVGLAGRVITEKRTIFEKNHLSNWDSGHTLHLEHFKSAIAAPIWSKEEIIGLIFLLSDHPNIPFIKSDQLILDTLCEHAAIAVVNAHLFKITATSSLNDYLTGVGNLRFFYQRLEHSLAVAERYQQPCSLLIVDSDSLKQINDQYGNTQGFRHIKQLAEILQNSIRRSDLIARYDRDMFVIILPQTNLTEAICLGEKLKNKVAESPLIIDDEKIETTVCVGTASFPAQAENATMLVTAVEAALHQAKRLGKNQLVAAEPISKGE